MQAGIEMTHPISVVGNSKPGYWQWDKQVLLAVACVYSVFYRLFPEYTVPNLAPIGALALFSGFLRPRFFCWIPPIAVMATSDVVLYFWKGYTPFNLTVYALFCFYALAGSTLAGNLTRQSWFSRVICSSLTFFLLTNGGQFITSTYVPSEYPGTWAVELSTSQYTYPLVQYSRDLPGLMTCYLYALPFLARTLVGDLVFSGLLFGLLVAMDKGYAPGRLLVEANASNS